MESSKPLRIIFMGTPEFAVASLSILLQHHFQIVAVVTAPDRPAGRGLQVQESAIKKFAVANNLLVLQPEKLKAEEFINQLQLLKADLQVVVAFRMLPEIVWNMPRLGTINLHASLLPHYRGAAPINWAIINGEAITGVSTFFLQQEIDMGKIIFSESLPIKEEDTAGTLHDKLMQLGAALLLKTVQAIEKGDYPQIEQANINVATLKEAPKLTKENTRINWSISVDEIRNKVRGLSPYPSAYAVLHQIEKENISIKILSCTTMHEEHSLHPGAVVTDASTYIKVAAKNGFIFLHDIQVAGKRKMPISELLRGFRISEDAFLD